MLTVSADTTYNQVTYGSGPNRFRIADFGLRIVRLRAVQSTIRNLKSAITKQPFSEQTGVYPHMLMYGEFDPGSGRTLAACLRNASRAGYASTERSRCLRALRAPFFGKGRSLLGEGCGSRGVLAADGLGGSVVSGERSRNT